MNFRSLILLLLIALIVVVPASAKFVYVNTSNESDAAIYAVSAAATWATLHDATSGTVEHLTRVSDDVQSSGTADRYSYIHRGVLIFELPSDAGYSITAATITLNNNAAATVALGDVGFVITNFTNATKSDGIIIGADYNNCEGATWITAVPFSSIGANNQTFTLNDLALSNMTPGQKVGMCLITESDYNNTAPAYTASKTSSYTPFSHENMAKYPTLNLTYTESATPISAFSGTPTIGIHPTVYFNNASTNTSSCLWVFGDGDTTNNTVCQAVHHYLGNGTYNVSLQTTGPGGSTAWENKSYYIYSRGFSHPISINQSAIPGVVNAGISPWSTAITASSTSCLNGWGGLNATANAGLAATFDGSSATERCYALYMAAEYAWTQNTTYANRTVDALLNQRPTFYAQNDGDYSIAYDLIEPCIDGGVCTLDKTNNSLIRTKLMQYISEYQLYANSASYGMNSHQHSADYAKFGLYGHILSDFNNVTNTSIVTSTDLLKSYGEAGLWSNDPSGNSLHQYTWRIAGDQGVMADWLNYNSGANTDGLYRDDVANFMNMYMMAWSHIHDRSYLEEYPSAKKYALTYTWQLLNYGKSPTLGTAFRYNEISEAVLYDLLDTPNRSDLHFALEYQNNSTFFVSQELEYGPSVINRFLYTENYDSEGLTAPTWTSHLTKNGEYNVFRNNWNYYGDTLVFVISNDTFYSQRSSRHQDQLSFDYSSHGDMVMPDASEIKSMPYDWTADGRYGVYGAFHNGVMIGNGTVNFTRMPYYSGNLTYRTVTKNTQLGLYNATQGAYTKTLIQTPNIEAIEGTFDNATISNADGLDAPLKLNQMVNVSRMIIYPLKEYFIIIDRGSFGTQTREHVIPFRFGSMAFTKNTTPIISNDLNQSARVNGTLRLDGIEYTWADENKLAALPISTGQTINNITWETTNIKGDKSNLTIYTSPATPATFLKLFSVVTGNSVSTLFGVKEDDPAAGNSYVLNPEILLVPSPATSSYRTTVILSRYANETEKTPLELTVTGTGSAISVVNGQQYDTIYTGIGISTANGFVTDGDTLFIRKNSTTSTVSDYVMINGSSVADGATTLLDATTTLDYAAVNITSTSGTLNVSGSGMTTFQIKVPFTVGSVTIDGTPAGTWSYSGGYLYITEPLSDHNIQFGSGGSGGDAGSAIRDALTRINVWLRKIRHSLGFNMIEWLVRHA